MFSGDKPIKIDYTQYDFVNQPNRIAYIGSSMYDIPFEGVDVFLDGTGAMKGVIAKLFVLFNQMGGRHGSIKPGNVSFRNSAFP